jgi:hypothetical protein
MFFGMERAHFKFRGSDPGNAGPFEAGKFGWGGRIRTYTIRINSAVSYRLDHAPADSKRLIWSLEDNGSPQNAQVHGGKNITPFFGCGLHAPSP